MDKIDYIFNYFLDRIEKIIIYILFVVFLERRMNNNIILKMENLIKVTNKDIYYEYLRILNIYKFFVGNITEFTTEDKLEILTFFYEHLLGELEDYYSPLDSSESFIFRGDKFRERNFRMALEYFRNRTILNLTNTESIHLIQEKNTLYPKSLMDFLQINSRTLEEVFSFNEQRFRDKLENLPSEKEFYRIYSDSYCDVIVIRKNFFSDTNPSFFAKDGLIIRFCESGQIGFEKDATLLNEKEALITKGIPLGDYKVLTNNIYYVTLHIKDEYFKTYNLEFPTYMLKKVPWRLTSETLEMFDKIEEYPNARIILSNFISDILLSLTQEEKRLRFRRIQKQEVGKILEYIDFNLDNGICVSRVQKNFGLNKNILSGIFKENFDISPSKYIINRKLEKASHLLLESDLSVTDIAFRFNFSSASKFSSHFKKKYSLTPLQFKKRFEKLTRS